MMRARLPLLAGLALLVAGFADNPIDARREDKAEHLLTEHFETWAAEIAGFNRRNAMCDPNAAKAAATYDTAHRTTFKRTLGWRFDDTGKRWVPSPPKQAEVTLIYSGPVRSGTVTLAGKAQSFCRAEAPDKIETLAVHLPADKGSVQSFGTNLPLPALPPGFDAAAGAGPPPGTGAPTPRVEIDARIATAASMLAQDVAGADAFIAASEKASVCTKAKADEMAKRWAGLSRSRTRTDGPVHVELQSKTYSGPVKEGEQTTWLCLAQRAPLKITATATWQAEGDDELIFQAEALAKP